MSATASSEPLDDDKPESTTSTPDTAASGDHAPAEQDDSPESNGALDEFNAGEFDSER